MSYKILLADDSVTVQKIVTLTFSDEGVDVVPVNNGDDAITRLQYMRPALVMADVGLPGRNGFEICEFVKNHPELKHTPVILLVPAFEPFDQAWATRVGADFHLTKPFQSIRALIATVKRLIEPATSPVATKPPVVSNPAIEWPVTKLNPPVVAVAVAPESDLSSDLSNDAVENVETILGEDPNTGDLGTTVNREIRTTPAVSLEVIPVVSPVTESAVMWPDTKPLTLPVTLADEKDEKDAIVATDDTTGFSVTESVPLITTQTVRDTSASVSINTADTMAVINSTGGISATAASGDADDNVDGNIDDNADDNATDVGALTVVESLISVPTNRPLDVSDVAAPETPLAVAAAVSAPPETVVAPPADVSVSLSAGVSVSLDEDDLLELDDILPRMPSVSLPEASPVATATGLKVNHASSALVSSPGGTGALRVNSLDSLTANQVPQNVIDEIVARVTTQVTVQLLAQFAQFTRQLAQEIAPSVAQEVIAQLNGNSPQPPAAPPTRNAPSMPLRMPPSVTSNDKVLDV